MKSVNALRALTAAFAPSVNWRKARNVPRMESLKLDSIKIAVMLKGCSPLPRLHARQVTVRKDIAMVVNVQRPGAM